jgi:hypothetical protein
MSKAIKEYFDALERLKNNSPINVLVGTPINKDTVALEAGRARGSIKKSRTMFADLIKAIDEVNAKTKEPKQKLLEKKEEVLMYKNLYEEALSRELMYLERINELEKLLKKYQSSNFKLSINN